MPTTRRRLQQLPLAFPRKGLVESSAYSDQPHLSSACLQNVMAFDPRSGRNRGGSRSGLVKYCPERVNGLASIQGINHVSNAVTPVALLLENGEPVLLEVDGSEILLEDDTAEHTGDRKTILVVVASGTVKTVTTSGVDDVTNGSSALSSSRITIFSTQFFGDLYYCDSYNYKIYESSSNEMTAWTPTSGSLPTEMIDGVARKCSLIVTWGGRIVMSGLISDGQNWFMSAVDDPLNWEYSPTTTTVQQAVAGNNSAAGLAGDIITALIPYTDDVLIFGGDHTIWRLRGNPAEDGRIDLVSDITGIAAGVAWCKSPEGIVYFFGSRGGVYKLEPMGGMPMRLTALSLDEQLADINLVDNQVSMEWDDRHLGVRVFVTKRPVDGVVQEDATHFFWDVRNEAWYTIKHTNKYHNSLAVHLFDGPDPNDRAVLIGTQDGWILKFDPDTHSDDGSPIESHVFLGPLQDVIVSEMQATFSTASGNVIWTIHSEDDFESALDSEPKASGDFVSGRNRSQWPKYHVDSGYVKLSSTQSWALEKLILNVEPDSETRSRIF